MLPKVSVIIPTKNRSHLLKKAISSVLKQTYKNLECIVVDDNSADKTKKIVNNIDDRRLSYFCHKTNKLSSGARNTGFKHSSGQYIAYLDDDDEWLPDKLMKQVELMNKSPLTVGLIYCWMNYFNGNGDIVKKHHPTLSGYVFPYILDYQRLGGCPTLLLRREVVENVGGFDENLSRGDDGDFIRRVCQKYHVDYVPEVLVNVHIDHGMKRLSDNDNFGIRQHIFSQQIKIYKFRNLLNEHPEPVTSIYLDLARSLAKLGEWQKSLYYFIKASSIQLNAFVPTKDLFYIFSKQFRNSIF